MNLVDSSAWLEYFADGPIASAFEKTLQETDNLIVPTICLYEVFKVVLRERGENDGLQAIALMKQGKVVVLTEEIAINAAEISVDLKFPMADSIILATAKIYEATIWTLDCDFKNIKGVKFFSREDS
jgi:predicted nucleic acid-binding protein